MPILCGCGHAVPYLGEMAICEKCGAWCDLPEGVEVSSWTAVKRSVQIVQQQYRVHLKARQDLLKSSNRFYGKGLGRK